jgi:hypothetical protein
MVHRVSPTRPRHNHQRDVLNGRDVDANDARSDASSDSSSDVRADFRAGLRADLRADLGADLGSEIGALRAENAELRKVVIALSRLVIRNVLRNDTRI